MEGKVSGGPAAWELAGRLELRLIGAERIGGSGIGNHHDLAVQRAIKKLLAVARPLGGDSASGGNLPLASRAGERPNEHFVATGFTGVIGEPVAVGREDGFPFEEGAVHEGLWLPRLPAGLLGAFTGRVMMSQFVSMLSWWNARSLPSSRQDRAYCGLLLCVRRWVSPAPSARIHQRFIAPPFSWDE